MKLHVRESEPPTHAMGQSYSTSFAMLALAPTPECAAPTSRAANLHVRDVDAAEYLFSLPDDRTPGRRSSASSSTIAVAESATVHRSSWASHSNSPSPSWWRSKVYRSEVVPVDDGQRPARLHALNRPAGCAASARGHTSIRAAGALVVVS